MGGDEAPLVADFDPGQVRGHVDEPADHRRVDGVVAAVDADVVVASQPDPVDPPDRGCDGWQRQHRRPIGVEQVDRPGLDGAHDPGVRESQPVGELGVEVGRATRSHARA